ncbi:putative ornithine carbamoyltransferase precursor [Cantharellus anzutake]|uniref:putative ornithine carbamoyltransferase precursor n=1 Tax=Cantharellus anzutake TaxID=1750568 RepID=UPI0019063ACF|nr:putative ornithine carbamoyltransferase precursor [Cantharellus anzutake]KAF8332330.1 putative ornithine carbamoyltransferase precursor [Cantharellus anzutake]
MPPPHLMTLADLSIGQIRFLLSHSKKLKTAAVQQLRPRRVPFPPPVPLASRSLDSKTVALLFAKRSTRTRVSAETATSLLGGRALFLGKEDIQLGVNESAEDTSKVLSSMVQGIFARVGDHSEIEASKGEMAKHSAVPVINALSSLWHPTQILADLLTLHEHGSHFKPRGSGGSTYSGLFPPLKSLTITWLGDSSNVLHDMLVTFPRFGHKMRVGVPPQQAYQCPAPVWNRVKELGCDQGIHWCHDPREAVNGADVVITDTWISMGQEAEKEQRLRDFQGYQVTEALCREGGANPDWRFLHCLPRKQHEVDDEVFYGNRSLVFPEAENRKWTIMALFDAMYGAWHIPELPE